MKTFTAIFRGFLDLFSPKIWLLIFLPPVVSGFLWIQVYRLVKEPLLTVWKTFLENFNSITSTMESIIWGAPIFEWIFWMFAIPTFVFIAWLTSLFLVGVFAVPWIRRYLKSRYGILREDSSNSSWLSTLRNFKNVVVSTALMFIGLILLSWIPGIWALGLFFIGAWMNTRLLFLEISTEISNPAFGPEGVKTIWTRERTALLTMGLIFGFLFSVPLVGFLVPVWSALSFFHYLCELEPSK